MNVNQLTKIPVEKLSDTLQFLIAENEIPLSDALKQVIDDVDALHVTPEAMPKETCEQWIKLIHEKRPNHVLMCLPVNQD